MTGVLFAAFADGYNWDKNTGLRLLFQLRGPVPPPEDILLIRLDNTSSDALGQAHNPVLWDRDIHAQLVNKLSKAGASVIAFDLWFKTPGNKIADNAFLSSVSAAGNVIMFSYLDREHIQNSGVVERLHPPFADLHQASKSSAPFMLPKLPIQLNEFWTFRPSTGDIASMPVQVFTLHLQNQFPELFIWLHAQHEALAINHAQTNMTLDRQIALLRQFSIQYPNALKGIADSIKDQNWSEISKHLSYAYLDLYLKPETRLINFYGPPLNIPNLAYSEVIQQDLANLPDLRNKIVYIGLAENKQLRQQDNFYSVFTRADGLDLSGVEIAATITNNLLYQTLLNPVPPWLVYASLLLLPAFLIRIALPLNNPQMVIAGILVSTGLFCFSYALFVVQNTWLPFMIPAVIQIPLVLLGLALLKHKVSRDQSDRVQKAFAHYIPGQMVRDFARGETEFNQSRENTWGICMATDAIGFTEFAEQLSPPAVRDYLNDYYEILFDVIAQHNGIITDVEGDAIMTIWRNPDKKPEIFEQARQTAIHIQHAVNQVKLPYGERLLGTRVGLHAGDMVLGNVGALGHYEYRAVGDTINTAARIQNLNKKLGTRILISKQMLHELSVPESQYLGHFEFKGKSRSLPIYTLYDGSIDQLPQWQTQNIALTQALMHYDNENYPSAKLLFTKILQYETNSAIAKYYLDKLRNLAPSSHEQPLVK